MHNGDWRWSVTMTPLTSTEPRLVLPHSYPLLARSPPCKGAQFHHHHKGLDGSGLLVKTTLNTIPTVIWRAGLHRREGSAGGIPDLHTIREAATGCNLARPTRMATTSSDPQVGFDEGNNKNGLWMPEGKATGCCLVESGPNPNADPCSRAW